MLDRLGRRSGALVLLLAAAGPVSAAPSAQDFDQRLTALERAVGSAGTGGNQSQAQLVIQLQQMQAELRQLRGMVEEGTNQVQQLQKRQRDFYLDLDGRLSALEQGGGAATGAAGGPSASAAGAATPPAASAQDRPAGAESAPNPLPTPSGHAAATDPSGAAVDPGPLERPVTHSPNTGSAAPAPDAPPLGGASQTASVAPAAGTTADPGAEQEAYRAASDLLRIGRYEEAIAGFQTQLQKYPRGALADNAQYWIGEAYYVTRQFDRALSEFQRVAAEYPQSPKAADALLKVGYIQYERRQFAAARQTLTGLKTTWPSSPAARLAENRLRRMQEEGV